MVAIRFFNTKYGIISNFAEISVIIRNTCMLLKVRKNLFEYTKQRWSIINHMDIRKSFSAPQKACWRHQQMKKQKGFV